MKGKHILYISYDGMTDPLGQSQVLPYLIGLSQEGFSISILSCEKKERYDETKDLISTIAKEHQIKWYPISYHRKPPIISTLWDIAQLTKKAKSINRNEKIDLLHCRSYIASLVGLRLKTKYKIPFIFDMRGFWADERVDGKIWNVQNPVYRLIYNYFKRKEKAFLLKADAIVSLTENARSEIQSWNFLRGTQIAIDVIPCCADLDFFSSKNITPAETETERKALGMAPNDYVMSYIGSLGTWYLLDEMLELFKRLMLKIPESKFLFITHENATDINSAAKKIGVPLKNIVVVKGTRKEMPLLISLSNVSVFFIKKAYSKKASSPTKLGELMGMGIPVICNTGIGDVDTIVTESRLGVIVNEFKEQDFDRKLDELFKLPKADAVKLNETARKYFSLGTGVNSYLKIYKRILNASTLQSDSAN